MGLLSKTSCGWPVIVRLSLSSEFSYVQKTSDSFQYVGEAGCFMSQKKSASNLLSYTEPATLDKFEFEAKQAAANT